MTDANEQSIPSRGSHGSPAAWGVMRVGGRWVSILGSEEQAETSRESFDAMENWVHVVRPLYEKQQPALTDEEREAMHRLCRAVTHYAAGGAVDGGRFARDDERAVAVVRGWLDQQN